MSVDWKGNEVKARALKAAKWGVDKVMSEAVISAKNNHPGWHNVTGTAEGSVNIVTFAQEDRDLVRGLWGSAAVHYVIWLELKHGSFLRSAAAATYPKLKDYIKEAFAR